MSELRTKRPPQRMAGDPEPPKAPKIVAPAAKKTPVLVAPGALVPPSLKDDAGNVIDCMVSVKGRRCKNPARHPIVDPSQKGLTFHICTTHSDSAQIALISAEEAGLVAKPVKAKAPRKAAAPKAPVAPKAVTPEATVAEVVA